MPNIGIEITGSDCLLFGYIRSLTPAVSLKLTGVSLKTVVSE